MTYLALEAIASMRVSEDSPKDFLSQVGGEAREVLEELGGLRAEVKWTKKFAEGLLDFVDTYSSVGEDRVALARRLLALSDKIARPGNDELRAELAAIVDALR